MENQSCKGNKSQLALGMGRQKDAVRRQAKNLMVGLQKAYGLEVEWGEQKR